MRTIARPHIDCSVEDCTKNAHAKGLCNMHKLRLMRTGTTDAGQRAKEPRPVIDPAELRYLRRLVDVPDDGPTPEDRKRYAEGEARP